MPKRSPHRALAILVSLTGLLGVALVPARSAAPRYAGLGGPGLGSAGGPAMQAVTVAARVARVAVVPAMVNGEAWAVGKSSAALPGWANDVDGQVVFLRYTTGTGWRLTGPPETGSAPAQPFNPVLADLAVAETGEGWAVGDGGTLLHHVAGTDRWTRDDASGALTTAMLQSVSLTVDRGDVVGYAVGKPDADNSGISRSTILRYEHGTWTREPDSQDLVTDGSPGLIGVAAVSTDEAWAVSDETTTGVRLYHRQNGTWQRVRTADYLEGPFPAPGRNHVGLVRDARASSIAANGNVVWVGGTMRATDPAREASGGNDDQTIDDSTPFMVRIASGAATTFCPDQYRLQRSGTETASLCDAPLPTSSFDIPSVSILSDGEAFAGGLGLLHYRDGAWFREPDSDGYIISVSMASTDEGWTASGGNTYFRGNGIRAVSTALGHFTRRPAPAHMARWPQGQQQVLEAVATSPDGTRAVAVGQAGASAVFNPALGWDTGPPRITLGNLHAVAWPGADPWVVGDGGFVASLIGGAWKPAPNSGEVTTRDLFAVAFRSPSDGLAVGAGGVILHFDGTRWTLDPRSSRASKEDLYAITATSDGYIAAGAKATVVELRGGDARTHPEVATALTRPGIDLPALYAAATRADGTVAVGGAHSALLAGRPGGPFAPLQPPIEGTVLALSAPSGGRGGGLLASVSPDPRKFDGNAVRIVRGAVLVLEDGGWRDLSLTRHLSTFIGLDSSAFDDPVLGLAGGATDARWAVGGTPAGTQSEEGHLRSEPTGSVYRVDRDGNPSPPDTTVDVIPPAGVHFAVFGESWCGRGVCGALSGTGTMADLVALRIRDEVNRAAARPDGPRFVLFAGNMRSSGIPEELAQFREYLRGFHIPVYAALGDRDLFQGIEGSGVAGTRPPPDVQHQLGTSGANDIWRDTFVEMPAPWGDAPAPRDIRPVEGITAKTAGARTHYAFDYLERGEPRLRVVVVDSSSRSLGDPSSQNPPEDQSAWLGETTQAARSAGIPTVVVLNQPTVIPDAVLQSNWSSPQGATDQTKFESLVASNGVSAVFSAGLRMNTTDTLPARTGVVPLYVVGGGGAPLGFERTNSLVRAPTKLPTDGFYHAWHLVTVDPSPERRNVLGQAPVGLESFAALDSLSMHSVDGDHVAAGFTMRFNALGRALPGGFSDPQQAKAAYLAMGSNGLSTCQGFGQGDIYCASSNAIAPPYRFFSENPAIADFVRPDFGQGGAVPARVPGGRAIIGDPGGRFGLLCSFRPGTVGINVQSGFFRRRVVITVGSGAGPCVDAPVVAPAVVNPPGVAPAAPVPAPEPAPAKFLPKPPPPPDLSGIALPPAPTPVAAPAPPASAAGAKKEEEEYEFQQGEQEHDGTRHEFRAAPAASRTDRYGTESTWVLASALLAFVIAASTVAVVRRRPVGAPVRIVR